jgi:hypothetical protein
MIRPGRKVNPPAITRAPVNNISIAYAMLRDVVPAGVDHRQR